MAKNGDVAELLFIIIASIVALYGFFAFIQPSQYPIPSAGQYSSLVGLILFILGAVFILKTR